MTFTKLIFFVLATATVSFAAKPTVGVKLPGPLLSGGVFPSHIADSGYGGWHVTDENAAMIPGYLKQTGMAVWSNLDDSLAVLTETNGWVELLSEERVDFWDGSNDKVVTAPDGHALQITSSDDVDSTQDFTGTFKVGDSLVIEFALTNSDGDAYGSSYSNQAYNVILVLNETTNTLKSAEPTFAYISVEDHEVSVTEVAVRRVSDTSVVMVSCAGKSGYVTEEIDEAEWVYSVHLHGSPSHGAWSGGECNIPYLLITHEKGNL